MTPERAAVVGQLADLVCQDLPGHPARVAVDGVTASGKSTLASEICAAVLSRGRPAVHLSTDDYHHPRERRHQRGRMSAAGYYEDAYDFEAFASYVLIPLGPGGDLRYRPRLLDLDSDQPVEEAPVQAPADAVVVVDGSFLQRPELAGHWDHRIFVATDLAVAMARGIKRDAGLFGSESQAELMFIARYHAACRMYLAAVRPAERATAIVDNNDTGLPKLRVRRGRDADIGALPRHSG